MSRFLRTLALAATLFIPWATQAQVASCDPVTNIWMTDNTTTGATFKFVDVANTGAQYVVKKGDQVLDGTTTPSVTVSYSGVVGTVTFGNLEPGVLYWNMNIVAQCGDADFSQPAYVPYFRALCDPVATYSTGFEEMNAGSLPVCWIVVGERGKQNTEVFPRQQVDEGFDPHSGLNSLRFCGDTGNLVITPQLSVEANTMQISFYARVYAPSSNCGTLMVGYLPAGSFNQHDFVPLETLSYQNYTDYKQVKVRFNGIPDNSRIAFLHKKPNQDNQNYTWFIDDVVIEPLSCVEVTNVTVDSYTSAKATLSWTDNDNSDNVTYTVYDYSVSPAVALGTTGAGVKTITLMGLTANHTYDQLKVVAYCSATDHSEPVDVPAFTTLHDIASITNFDIPAYSLNYLNDQNNYTIWVRYIAESEFPTLDGIFEFDGSGVYLYNQVTGAWDINVSTFELLREHLNLGDPSLEVRVFAEDVEVYEDWVLHLQPEPCTRPRSITFSDVTRTGFTATWVNPDPNVANFQVVISKTELTEGQLNGSSTAKIDVSGAVSYAFTNLDREQVYHVYVRADCGEGELGGHITSEWQHASVTTKGLVDCEDVVVANGTSTTRSLPYSAWYHNSYTQQLYTEAEIGTTDMDISALKFNYIGTTTTTRNITIYLGTTDATSFYGWSSWATPADMTEVFHAANVTFANDGSGWFELPLDVPFTYNGGNLVVAMYMNYTTDETGYENNKYFVCEHVGSNTMALVTSNDVNAPNIFTLSNGVVTNDSPSVESYRNNIKFTHCVTIDACPAVESVTASNITATNADVTWTGTTGDYFSGYQVIRSKSQMSDADLDEFIASNVMSDIGIDRYDETGTMMQFIGLEKDTDYYLYVRAVCQAGGHDDGYSEWVGTHFRTLATCSDPTLLPATDITANTATFHSEFNGPVGEVSTYTFRYWAEGNEANKTTVPPSAQNSATVTGLVPGTTYYYDALATCTGTDGDSRWTEPQSFTTSMSHTVNFSIVGNGSISLTVNGVPATFGNSLQFDDGTQVVATATPDANYHFVNWSEGGTPIPGAAPEYGFTVVSDRDLVANFAIDRFTVTLTNDNSYGINVAGAGEYDANAAVTLAPGGDLTITAAGVYILSGSYENQMITVRAGEEDKVQIVLNNAQIMNADGPAILVGSADKVFLTAAEGSENSISDGAGYMLSEGDTSVDAAVFSKADLTINGSGSLSITGNNKHAVVSKDDLVVTAKNLSVSSAASALTGKDAVTLSDAYVSIQAGTDGIHSEGTVSILGGSLSAQCGDDAVHADGKADIAGGTVTLHAAEGIEATYVLIRSGEISIQASDDGINAAY